jgi:hypothetical protein
MDELDPARRRLVETHLRLREAARALLPEAPVPYQAHLRVETGGRIRELLLGPVTRAGPDVSIVSWQEAPLAEAFFAAAEGEEYELEIAGRTLAGRVLEKSPVSFAGGELSAIVRPDALLVRGPDGSWRARPPPPLDVAVPPRRGGEPHGPSPFVVHLDPAQERIVALPPGRHALVLGEAGFGKTTVALHRLARLCRSLRARARAAVIVPTEGLRRLAELQLERLGVAGVEVWLYDRFAASQARRAFPFLPRRESKDASAGVIRLKRHPAVRAGIDAFLRLPPPKAGERPGRRRASAWDRLQHLFGDRALLARILAAAGGELPAATAAEVFEHTHVQFSATAEEEFEGVDEERLRTVDGLSIDEGTPTGDVGTIDAEDYAVLFELDRRRAAAKRLPVARPRLYDLLVIDEAQELAPLELALVGRCLAPKGTLVVAGDAGQQVDPSAGFAGWTATMAELGATAYETTTLEVSYRCPDGVTALARSILDPADPRGGGAGAGEREGTVARVSTAAELHLVAALIDGLRELRAAAPSATAAVIARTPGAATRLARLLGRGLDVRLVREGAFDFAPGVQVTHVQEVKGLEFDVVVIPDATAAVYPDAPAARRALYVAATRATRKLVLAAAGTPTPLVGP